MVAICATLLACEPSSHSLRDSGITGDIAFVDVTVLQMTQGDETLARQTVLVSGDSIVAMGATTDVQVQTDAIIVDGAGRFLMPGLTDKPRGSWVPWRKRAPSRRESAPILFCSMPTPGNHSPRSEDRLV